MPDTHLHPLKRYDPPPTNADFSAPVVIRADEGRWLESDTNDVFVKLYEAVACPDLRLTMVVQFLPGSVYDLRPAHGGEEFLVLEGSINDARGIYKPGHYVRNPVGTEHILTSAEGCILFAKLGEASAADAAYRLIDTHDKDSWLPGPVDHTRVLPLHVHDTRCVMMIHWDEDATFKPGLNPKGEEIFVISGALTDEHSTYKAGDWIRNPLESWQDLSAIAGTRIYYKNGHFPSPLIDAPTTTKPHDEA